jgi:regulation of enolase protein 1 (concanavalin A-like superfamily)
MPPQPLNLFITIIAKLDAYQFWYDQCTVRVILSAAEWFRAGNLLLIKGYLNNL